ncbi:LysR family transcriptional regulator [Streptomyces sp. ISL-100]|uniref:LysR family transcriptional regulator n=1 Tax=Streptomyces sp. ISL-100 TaxID=2819173 RepID=UPI001BECEE30|nr:LysR family transcriptional regulator [Streptomyces sp. ISL-100]MBT2399300.1 LysR family transcriptional regulator [Streptomyces sp. ISL-100]
MELQQLRVFREVARELSFTQAARNLHCAQSTITGQIKSLESSLDAVLFLRRGRYPIELTAAGAVLESRVDQILQAVDTAGREVRGAADRRGDLGRRRANCACPHPLQSVQRRFPSVTVGAGQDSPAPSVDHP